MKPRLISGSTRVCGIMGDPVAHSLSPAMQNAAFLALGLDYVYVPFHVTRPGLSSAVASIKDLNIRGLNVTLPHKEAVLPLLDEIDLHAKAIGAVNVILNEDGRLIGYNTDAQGFLWALERKHIAVKGKKVVVLGAGGAARAVGFALADLASAITLLNRTPARAESLAQEIARSARLPVKADGLERTALSRALAEAEIIINATSAGMSPCEGQTPVAADMLHAGLTVIDIIYNPMRTRLLLEAEQAGAAAVNGLDMLVCQGALAFKLWTGQEAPYAMMKKEALAALQHYAH